MAFLGEVKLALLLVSVAEVTNCLVSSRFGWSLTQFNSIAGVGVVISASCIAFSHLNVCLHKSNLQFTLPQLKSSVLKY